MIAAIHGILEQNPGLAGHLFKDRVLADWNGLNATLNPAVTDRLAVQSMSTKVGNTTYTASQATATKQPTLVNALKGGTMPVVRFVSSSTQFLNGGDIMDLGIGSKTILWAGKTTTNTANALFGKTIATGAINKYLVYYDTGGYNFLHVDAGQYPTFKHLKAFGSYDVLVMVIDRVTATLRIYANAVLVKTQALTNTPLYDFSSTWRFLIGAASNSTDTGEEAYFSGDHVTLNYYTGAFTDQEVADQTALTKSYWGI